MAPGRASASRSEIESCIEDRAFQLAYQPIVHLDTGTIAGVEALCRFDDGAPPERRFQQCERLGLASALDLAIIERAVSDLPGLPPGYLSINLSPSTLLDPRLGDLLLGPKVPGDRVVIEVTEHARITDYETAEQLLSVIRANGTRLAVDDAGAGYATFRHILSLRPDIIKMDRSITQDIDSDTARRALATALVIFAGEIGANVIAEGVETSGEILALRRAGIHRAQGFALARPQALPLAPVEYEPLAVGDLLELPALPSEVVPPLLPTGSAAVRAHELLASADAIAGVLDVLNEHLTASGEERYRGLLGTAQRQARHVGGALRAMVQGLPPELVLEVHEDRAPDRSRIERAARAPAGDEPARSRARRRLRATVEAMRAAQTQVEDTVSLGRKAGVSWDEIAEVLGMTRQGAAKRYGRGRLD